MAATKSTSSAAGQDDPDNRPMESLDRLRRAWRAYWGALDRRNAAWQAHSDASWQAWRCNPSPMPWREPPRLPHVPFPPELHLLICGARTRAGTPCKRRDLYRSGRCKLHGGTSTGPRTDEGKARAAQNGAKQWRADPERTPCEGLDYGKASRTPCAPRGCTNVGEGSEPLERLTKANVPGVRQPGGPLMIHRRNTDAV